MAPQEHPPTTAEKDNRDTITPVSVRTVQPYDGGIVVSGISGRYPESTNVGEFRDNLFNKVNMLTVDDRRWEPGLFGTPLVMGKLKNDLAEFDAEFFGVHSKSANTMDPMLRMMLEVAYEAIVDAGESLTSMKGTRTGVYIGVSSVEFEMALCKNWTENEAYIVQGCPHSMFANWVSYFFDLRGPSCAYDTACSTSLVCLEAAERHMRQGVIDCAIVGGCNILLRPKTSEVFVTMNFLSQTACKTFDVSGDGFVRAEVVSALLLKKADDAKRVYSTLVASMTNNDGFQPNGIMYPNTVAQEELICDFYTNVKINPNEIQYFECHGTGTQAGDPQETKAICNGLCSRRKDTLLIGSVKSNMGHGETSSGMASLSKLMIIMHSRKIPPNLHFNTPNPNIPGLFDGRLKVVTETTPFDGGLVSMNSFGMGGTNAHAIFRSFDKKAPSHPASDKPRLFVYSARTEEGLEKILEEAHNHASDVEFHALCQQSANTKPKNMPYRGATILNGQEKVLEIQRCSSKPREVWFIYSGMGSQWLGMGQSLMALDVFRESIEATSDILKPLGVDLLAYIKEGTEKTLQSIMAPFILINAVQLALTDLLKSLGIVPDGIVGHSLGEVGCAYADGCLTRREAILSAYWRAKVVLDGNVPPGKMAAVELTWEEARRLCPPGVVAACHNSQDSVTISGGAQEMTKFMAELTSQGVMVKEVNSSNISYHSPFMKELSVDLKNALEKEIVPKPRGKRWISTSIPEERWGEPVAQTAGADYHASNLLSPVLFYEGLKKVPSNAIAIEIAPSGLLQSVIKKSLGSECISVALQKRKHPNNLEIFFAALGKCYSHGVPMNPLGLYPPVQFPVSIETPMLSSLVSQSWDHSSKWRVPVPEDFELSTGSQSDSSFEFDLTEDSPDSYLLDHSVDGRMLFPATGTLVLAWKTLANMKGVEFDQLAVQLTNVQIKQALFLFPSSKATLSVSVLPITGEFQVRDGESLLSTGVITSSDQSLLETDQHKKTGSALDGKPVTETVNVSEIYREFSLRGYEYGQCFQGIRRASVDGLDTDIRWDGNWITYFDTVLQMYLLANPGTHQTLPVLLESVTIDPRVHPPAPPKGTEHFQTIPGHREPVLDMVAAGGVEIRGSHTIRSSRRLTHNQPLIEEFTFAPYTDPSPSDRTAPAITQALRNYNDACFEFSRQGMKRWLAEDKNNVLPYKQDIVDALALANKVAESPDTITNYSSARATLEALVNSQNGHRLPNHGVFEMLDMAFSEPLQGDYQKPLQVKLHNARHLLWDDPIVSVMEKPEIVKLIIDTVVDNIPHQVLEVLEVGASRGSFFRQAIPKALEFMSSKDWRYTVADKFFVEDAVDYPVKVLQFDPLDPANFPAAQNESCDLLVLKWTLHQQVDLDSAITAFSKMLKPGGFILVQENVERVSTFFPIKAIVAPPFGGKDGPEGKRMLGGFYTDAQWSAFFSRHGFEQIMHRNDGILASLFLLRKPLVTSTPPVIVHINDLDCSWLEEAQAKCKQLEDSPKDARLWLVAKAELSGMLGFYRSLVWDITQEKIRCIQVCEDKSSGKLPEISAHSAEFKELARKDLTYNVFRDGRWGTYRGFVISHAERKTERPSDKVYADWQTAGDISSLRWFDSPLKTGHHNGMLGKSSAQEVETKTCSVYFTGLNLRDVMLANGTVKRDNLPEETYFKEGVLGIEFSGRDWNGKRVMGLCPPPALASCVQCPVSSLWTVPDHWTLEEAATVPLAYATAYYCLVILGGLQNGKTVFIHAGASPVGQACIAVAQSLNCEVFTLTSTKEESDLLKTLYPKLQDKNICSSSDCSFEKHIRKETDGRGVDVIVNTLRDKYLGASRRLLAKKGQFLDIGFQVDSKTQIAYYTREQPDLRFQLDALLEGQGHDWTRLYELLQTGIQSGVVKPLKRSVYGMDSMVDAFKTVEAQRETAKVLVKVREEEKQRLCQTPKSTFAAVRRTCFDPSKSHILIGGMGGMGLETAHWMVLRGAKKLVLTSRSGLTTGYQARKISYLRQLGVEVEVLALSVNSRGSANKLFDRALKMGPLGGIFNMAATLQDGHFTIFSREDFMKPMESKITTTMLLDQMSREKPVRDTLDHFVMFSSLSVTHGHIGQTNYSFGSRVLEEVCERRKRDGLPACCPQWASIADVGIVAELGSKIMVSRKLPQRFFNVLDVLDYMMTYDGVITTSLVLADRTRKAASGEQSAADLVIGEVSKILGIKNLSKVDGDKEFIDMGVDSLMNVEIKQALERDIDLVISTKDIQLMTFNSLRSMVEGL